ncbi:hypothetical protein MKEN_00266700 [Mycena kentingensis (nom. inval.)]|nr:hypothetical protein MKEN_00266700 [Mycena kentingensis (nom. inval.)]
MEQLNEDLLLLICLELPTDAIRSLRQVSRAFNAATRSQHLWLMLLRRVHDKESARRRVVEEYGHLDASLLERLVERFTVLAANWNAEFASPIQLLRLSLPLSVDWVGLVGGNWLFLAASNDLESKLSCYNLSDIGGTVHAYLPGRVETAKYEVQDGRIVLALGLAAERVFRLFLYASLIHANRSPSVHIITLQQRSGTTSFYELSRLLGSSHVVMLSGPYVGCAVYEGANIPHLCNWTTRALCSIPPPPGGLQAPSRRSVPHLMALWRDHLIVVRSCGLEIYTMDEFQGTPCVTFVKLVDTPSIWEAECCSRNAADSLQLVVMTPEGIELLVLQELEDHQLDFGLNPLILIQSPAPAVPELEIHSDSFLSLPVFFRLRLGSSGRRMLWIGAVGACNMCSMHLVHAPVRPEPPQTPGHFQSILVDDGVGVALYAVPAIDFDDEFGLVVVGNRFGEVGVYDYGALKPAAHTHFGPDLTIRTVDPVWLERLSEVPLGLALWYSREYTTTREEFKRWRSRVWGRDYARLSRRWSRMDSDDCFATEDDWFGIPCDQAWLLAHAYGFPGEALIQGFRYNEAESAVVLHIGEWYFGLCEEFEGFMCWSRASQLAQSQSDALTPADRPDPHMVQPLTSRTALTVRRAYEMFYHWEVAGFLPPRRDRWMEFFERGGRPPAVIMRRMGLEPSAVDRPRECRSFRVVE